MPRVQVLVAAWLAAAAIATVGCTTERAQPPAASTQPVTLTMENSPNPPAVGDSVVTIEIKQGDAPVSDASVTGEFFMPVMESMGKTTVVFTPGGNGRYTGHGTLSMAGSWQVAVTARRGGQTIATRTFNLTTKEPS